ncbi:hypothetical protein [Thermoactinomyces sp. DSM 45892]|uniref:hypothetical protein n=1 Tax=Thermoactinomyces sp. DSM 45892 TaxID=1882753 RepID=UPI0011607BE9|nr:hypothetical protein [Thermoactinomyces sp. DSM 45892]
MGVIINVYSNVTSGIAKNGEPLVFFKIGGIVVDEAVLIGGLIPLLIVAAEMVVQDALLHQKQKKEVENSPLTPVKIGDSIFTKIDDSSNNVIVVSPGELDGGIVGDSKPFHIEIDDHIKQNRGLEEIAYKQESEDLIPPIKEIEKISLMKEEEITPPVIQETPENISTFSSQYGDNQEESPTENSKESSKIVMEKPSNPPAKKRKISRKKVTSTPSSSHAKSPYEIALQLYKEDGEVPGRGKLQEVAGCKEWPARQAIKQLKENIG